MLLLHKFSNDQIRSVLQLNFEIYILLAEFKYYGMWEIWKWFISFLSRATQNDKYIFL